MYIISGISSDWTCIYKPNHVHNTMDALDIEHREDFDS